MFQDVSSLIPQQDIIIASMATSPSKVNTLEVL